MSKFYIEGEQTMDEMSHIDYEAVKGGKGNISKICPMKFFAIVNNEFCDAIGPEGVSNFMKCNKEKCAWWCQYLNGNGECAIRSLTGIFKEIRWN